MAESPSKKYGGDWTERKLKILRKYLSAYTKALKNMPFKLLYIDAFAGTGMVELETNDSPDAQKFIEGSARIAANVGDKPFDKLIFIEQNRRRCKKLEELKGELSHRNMEIQNTDANAYLEKFCGQWSATHSGWRGVLFLDPFATQVEWKTVQAVADTNALDTWILFPVSSISRMLPRNKMPQDVDAKWAAKLTRVFGDESWKSFYHPNPQLSLLPREEDGDYIRHPGVKQIRDTYKQSCRVLSVTGCWMTPTNLPIRKTHYFSNSFSVPATNPESTLRTESRPI